MIAPLTRARADRRGNPSSLAPLYYSQHYPSHRHGLGRPKQRCKPSTTLRLWTRKGRGRKGQFRSPLVGNRQAAAGCWFQKMRHGSGPWRTLARACHPQREPRRQGLAGVRVPHGTGRALTGENFRKRVLAPAIKRANDDLEGLGQRPLPAKLTPPRTAPHVLLAALRGGGPAGRNAGNGPHRPGARTQGVCTHDVSWGEGEAATTRPD